MCAVRKVIEPKTVGSQEKAVKVQARRVTSLAEAANSPPHLRAISLKDTVTDVANMDIGKAIAGSRVLEEKRKANEKERVKEASPYADSTRKNKENQRQRTRRRKLEAWRSCPLTQARSQTTCILEDMSSSTTIPVRR